MVEFDDRGRPVLTHDERIDALLYCIKTGAKEDAFNHLTSLMGKLSFGDDLNEIAWSGLRPFEAALEVHGMSVREPDSLKTRHLEKLRDWLMKASEFHRMADDVRLVLANTERRAVFGE